MKTLLRICALLVFAAPLLAQSSGTYTYDGAGNITAIGPNSYSYDPLGRLTNATVVSGGVTHVQAFGYDAYGNMTSRTTDGVLTNIGVDANKNRLTDVVADAYDEAGNLRIDGAMRYEYDALGQMSEKVVAPSVHEYYIYDANDERIAVRVAADNWHFTFRDLAGKPLREFRASEQNNWSGSWTWVQDWIWRDGQLLASDHPPTDGGRQHYHLDHLGTPRLATSTNGLTVARHDYYPYGVEITPLRQETAAGFSQEQAMKFTGHERDFTGGTAQENTNYVDYMHARSYSAGWGRFLSPDRHVMTDYDVPQKWNRYSYVVDSPLAAFDPGGMEEARIAPPPPKTLGKWTPEQRAAENLKNLQRAEAAARGELVVTRVEGASGLRGLWESAFGPVPSGQHVDHIIDRQLGGGDVVSNAQPLDASVNMSNGARTAEAIKGLPPGTKITTFQSTLVSFVNIAGFLDFAIQIRTFQVDFRKANGRDPNLGEISRFLQSGDRRTDAQVLYDFACGTRPSI